MDNDRSPSPDALLDSAIESLRDRPIPPGPRELGQSLLIQLLNHRQGQLTEHSRRSLWKSNALRLAIAAILLLVFSGPLFKAGNRQDNVAFGDDLHTARMKVDLLRMLYDLQATPDQLRTLQRIASNTQASEKDLALAFDSHVQAAVSYPQALAALHEALLTNNDDKIDAAEQQVDDLADKFEIDDVNVTATPTARAKAEEALKLFSASQIAGYIAEHNDDVEDPAQVLLDAISDCRGTSSGEFAALRDDTARNVSLLIVGIDPRRADPVARKVAELLERAQRLSDLDFDAQHAELEQSARQIANAASSFEVLQHWMLGSMARLLSNPQLGNTLNERLQHINPQATGK